VRGGGEASIVVRRPGRRAASKFRAIAPAAVGHEARFASSPLRRGERRIPVREGLGDFLNAGERAVGFGEYVISEQSTGPFSGHCHLGHLLGGMPQPARGEAAVRGRVLRRWPEAQQHLP